MTKDKPFSVTDRSMPVVVLLLLGLIGFVVFKDYLLFQKIYFFKGVASDSYNCTYPFLYNAAGYIHQYGMPGWSFSYGMGQSIFPFILRDPFDIFLYIAGKDHIFYGMVYKEFLKILCSGLAFYYYLRTLDLPKYVSLVGSLLYSFCGFMIIGSCWSLFSFEAFNMALLLLAFELLFTRQRWYLFPIAIFLIGISQPFNLYVYGVFLIGYAILRLLQTNSFNLKAIAALFLKMLGLSITGLLLSGPFFLENIMQILESPRGSGRNAYTHSLASSPVFGTPDKVQFGTDVYRFFSNDLAGTGSFFNGWHNFLEAPMFYCGLLCLLLLPHVFRFLERRIKIAFIIFIAVWLLPIAFPWLRYAFWLFSGDYYRAYSLFVAFFFVYYSLYALAYIIKNGQISSVTLLVTLGILLVFLNYPYFPDKSTLYWPDKEIPVHFVYVFINIMLIVYSIVLYFLGRQGTAQYAKYVLLLAVIFELSFLSRVTLNNIENTNASELLQRKGYNDYTIEAVNYLKQTDHSFYRIDKSYFSTPARFQGPNDALAQGYRGTGSYSPFNQLHTILYMQQMGVINKESEYESRWTFGLFGRPALESENRVKYLLAKNDIRPFWRLAFDSVAQFGDVKVFRNKYVLPVGFTYDSYIKESTFAGLSNDLKDQISLKACVVADAAGGSLPGMKEFSLKDTVAAGKPDTTFYRQAITELSKDTLKLSEISETLIAGTISVGANKMMYLSVPWDGGWNVKVDGTMQSKVILNGGMTGVMLAKGDHTFEMHYEIRYLKKGLLLTLFGMLLYAGMWLFRRPGKKMPASTSESS